MLTSHPIHLFPKETLPTEPKKGAPAPPPKRVGPTRPLFPNPMEMVLTASQLLSPSPFCPVSDFSSSRPSPSWSQAPPSSLSPTQQRHKRNSWAGPSSPGHSSLGPGWVQSSPPSPSVQERSPACDALPASVPAAIRSQPLSSLICFLPRILPSEFSSFQKMATTGKHRPQGPSWSGLAPFTGTFVLPFLCTPCSLLDPLHFAGHAPRSPAEMPRTLRHWDRSPPTLIGSSALGTALPPYQSPTGLAPGGVGHLPEFLPATKWLWVCPSLERPPPIRCSPSGSAVSPFYSIV